MDWSAPVSQYCERADASFWAEPLNAATNAAFLIAGDDASILVETGHPKDFPVIERHLNELFARGAPPLKYLFVTHQETPHCGGLDRRASPRTFADAMTDCETNCEINHY